MQGKEVLLYNHKIQKLIYSRSTLTLVHSSCEGKRKGNNPHKKRNKRHNGEKKHIYDSHLIRT